MKIFRIILLIALLLGSVAVAGWLCLVGVGAPENSKITGSTTAVQNAATVEEGVAMMGEFVANQIGDDMLTLEQIEAEEAKLKETKEVHIPAYEAKVAAKKEAYDAAAATMAELGDPKKLNPRQKKQYAAAEAVVADYKATADTLAIYNTNVEIMTDNIAASKVANKNAVVEGENMIALANATSAVMIWAYILFGLIILLAIASVILGWVYNPKTLITVAIVVAIAAVVGGVAYYFAVRHGWNDGIRLQDAAGYDLGVGTDPATREVFGAKDYMIADISITICYIVAGMTGVAVLFAFFGRLFKSYK